VYLVALISSDKDLLAALRGYVDEQRRFHLHPVSSTEVSPSDVAAQLGALARLDFAGALVIGPPTADGASPEAMALSAVSRTDIDSREAGALDTVIVTPSGLVGEYNIGRAVTACLASVHYNARGARAAIIGSGPSCRALARELASLGVSELTVLAANKPDAERSVPTVAASTNVSTRALNDPLAGAFLEQADLIVRLRDGAALPARALGPHLTFVDLANDPVSDVRERAMRAGATTFNRADVVAHLIAFGIGHILGGTIIAEPFLQRLHSVSTS
jgi:shikimate 5-dehydrogenase